MNLAITEIGSGHSDHSLHQPNGRGLDIRPVFWRHFRATWSEFAVAARPRRGEVKVALVDGQLQWINIMEPGVEPSAMMSRVGKTLTPF